MSTTRVLHYVFIQTECVGERKRRCMPFGVPMVWRVPSKTLLTVISIWCPVIKMVCPWRRSQHLCIRIYHKQFCLRLMAMTSSSWNSGQFCYVLWRRRQFFFKQRRTAAISFKCCRQFAKHSLPTIIRSQKASSMTSSGMSNFQKEGRTFGINVTTVEFTTPLPQYILNSGLRRIL